MQVVDYSSVPKSPFIPNIKTNVLYSVMVGLMLGCFISFGIEFFSTKLRDEEELKKKFPHIPYLGAIPMAEEADLDKLERIVYTNPRSVVSEAFRVIRTSILYSSMTIALRIEQIGVKDHRQLIDSGAPLSAS